MVRVAIVGDAIEASMVKGLLEEAGIEVFLVPSGARVDGMELAFGMMARGSMGGPQDVMVPEAQAREAAAVLAAMPGGDDEQSA